MNHNVNVVANYTVNPRLALSVNENFVNSLQPELVRSSANAPLRLCRRARTFTTPWGVGSSTRCRRDGVYRSTALGTFGSTKFVYRSNNNHQDYSATLSALYLWTRAPRRAELPVRSNIYVNAGTNNALDAVSHTLVSIPRAEVQPTPVLVPQGGYYGPRLAGRTQSTSPSAYGSLVYVYGPTSTITLTLAQSLSEATIGVNRQFRRPAKHSFVLQISHRLTARLRAIGDITYVYSSFTQPLGAGATTGR